MGNHSMNDNVVSSFLDILLARKLLVIIGCMSVIVTSTIGIYLMPSMYKATTKIVVNTPAVPKVDLPYLSDLRGGVSFIYNQRELIRSQKIYEKVVNDLKLYQTLAPSSFINRLKKIVLKVKIYPFEEAVDLLYRNTSVDIIKGTNIIQITAYSNSSTQAAEIANAIANTYIKYINSFLTEKTSSAYGIYKTDLQEAESLYKESQARLKIFEQKENVSSPASIDSEISDGRKRISELEILSEKIHEEIQILEYSIANPNMNLDTDTDEGSRSSVTTQKPGNPVIANMENELGRLRNELRDALRKNTENHPNVKRLKDQVQKLEDELARNEETSLKQAPSKNEETVREKERKFEGRRNKQKSAQKAQENLKARRDYLARKIDKINDQILSTKKRIQVLNNNSTEYARLSKETGVRERDYLILKERLGNLRVLKANESDTDGSIKVIDPANPPGYPDNKKKIILFVVGIMVSLFFGIGMAFIAEFFDDSLRSREDAEKYLRLNVLGIIPQITKEMREGKNKY